MNIPSRGSKEERIRISCEYGLIYRVTDIINKTEVSKYVSVRVRYRVTWHASMALAEGGLGAVGARGELGAGVEGEWEVEVEAGAEAEAEGVPLTEIMHSASRLLSTCSGSLKRDTPHPSACWGLGRV